VIKKLVALSLRLTPYVHRLVVIRCPS
jgi:hypothetical protein